MYRSWLRLTNTHNLRLLTTEPEMPEHNLEPPRFCRRALEKILNDWSAVCCVLSTGHRPDPLRPSGSTNTASGSSGGGGGGGADTLYEDQLYLKGQSGTQRLDKFTHTLLVKCNMEVRRRGDGCFIVLYNY